MTAAPHRRTSHALLWLALAIIFTHALVPTGSPLRKSSGSAFNPFTAEVALGPKRADTPGKERHAPAISSAGDGIDLSQVEPPSAVALFNLAYEPRASGASSSRPALAPSGRPGRRAFEARAPPSA